MTRPESVFLANIFLGWLDRSAKTKPNLIVNPLPRVPGLMGAESHSHYRLR